MEKDINKTTMNCNIVTVEGEDGRVSAGMAWNDPGSYPYDVNRVNTVAGIYKDKSPIEAAGCMARKFARMARENNWSGCMVAINAGIEPKTDINKYGAASALWGVCNYDGTGEMGNDPADIRAHAARKAALEALGAHDTKNADWPLSVIITAGATSEQIDDTMRITSTSTGELGAKIAETMLNADGEHAHVAEKISRLYYLSPNTAVKPVVPDGQACKLECISIEDAQDMLSTIERIYHNDNVHAIIHSSAVGSYKARYSARAEDVAEEIAKRVAEIHRAVPLDRITKTALSVLAHPECVISGTRLPGGEPNLFTMMDQAPKVISELRTLAPQSMVFGFKQLGNTDKQDLFDAAAKLRLENNINYAIAYGSGQTKNSSHQAIIVGYDHIAGRDAVFADCNNKAEIADAICRLAFGQKLEYQPAPRTFWHVIGADNMGTEARTEGFAQEKSQAWLLMAEKFMESMQEMLPGATGPKNASDLRPGFEFNYNGMHAAISDYMAFVYDGTKMRYYNLIPMQYHDAGPLDNI